MAVIGCGRWGRNHIRVFSGLSGARLVAAADIDGNPLRPLRSGFPRMQIERDYRKLLENRQVEAVVIATPTSTHFPIARQALQSGRHVLCEKPLCENVRQADELVRLSQRHRRTLMVGHTFLFNPGIVKVKELIDKKELGPLFYLSSTRTNLGPIRTDVNVVYDLASHDVAIFNWLLGSVPEGVSACGAAFLQRGVEDVAFLTLRYPRHVLASVHVSWLNPKKVRQIIVVGKRKMATWDDLKLHLPVAVYDRGAKVTQEYGGYGEFLRVSMWEGDVRLPKIRLEEPLKIQDRVFLEAIGSGHLGRSDGKFSVGVTRVLEAMTRSLRSNGGAVPVR